MRLLLQVALLCAVLISTAFVGARAAVAAPAPPTRLTVLSRGPSSVQLAWAPSATTGVVGYRAYLRLESSGAGGWSLDGTTSAMRWTFSGLPCGRPVALSVAAITALGAEVSAFPVVRVKTKPCTRPGVRKVAPPIPPSPYQVPSDATAVATSNGLARALANRTVEEIVLENGTYDNPWPFVDRYGTSIYARHLGGAVLTAGLTFVRDGGRPVVRGLRFDVGSIGSSAHGAALWSRVSGLQVLDIVRSMGMVWCRWVWMR